MKSSLVSYKLPKDTNTQPEILVITLPFVSALKV